MVNPLQRNSLKKSWLVRLAGDRCGQAMVEFALIGPMFITLLLGIFEIAGFLLVNTLLEGGAREAARFGITGREIGSGNREDRIRQIVEDHAVGIIEASDIDLDTKVYRSFDRIGEPEAFTDVNGNGAYDPGEPFDDVNGNGEWDDDQGSDGLGTAGDIVVYTISYDWQVMTPLFRPLFPRDGLVTIETSLAVRNEPWPTS